LKYGGNGWRKVATGKRQKSLKLMNRLAGWLIVVWVLHSKTILYINFIRTWVRKLLLCD
jgi:hypothetical protein